MIFVRYDDEHMPQVSQTANGQLEVRVWEPIFGREMVLSPDMLALSTAVVPSPGTRDLAETLDVPLSIEGFFQEAHLWTCRCPSGAS